MSKQTESAKKFWANNKDKVLVGSAVVFATVAAIQRIGLKQHDDFLKEHDLFDAFYTVNEED